jgi:hypothetical protein
MKSFIWKIPKDDFANTIKDSKTWTEVMQKYYHHPSNTRTIKARVKKENINTTHFTNKKEQYSHPRYNLNKLLMYNPNHKFPNQRLKNRLVKDSFLFDQCYTCGLINNWCGKPLTLHLVHINNNSFDNRLENIIIQCPNCYSQFKQGDILFLNCCYQCQISIPTGIKKCKHCSKPNKELLKKDLIKLDFRGVQKKYGISKIKIIRWLNS